MVFPSTPMWPNVARSFGHGFLTPTFPCGWVLLSDQGPMFDFFQTQKHVSKEKQRRVFEVLIYTSTLGTLFNVGPVLHGIVWQRLPVVHFPSVSARPLGQVVNPSHLVLEPFRPNEPRSSRYLKAPLFHHFCNCISDSSFGPKTCFFRTTSSCHKHGKRIPSFMDPQSGRRNYFTSSGQVFATVILDEGIIDGPSQKINFSIAVHGTFRARAEDWTPIDRYPPLEKNEHCCHSVVSLPKRGNMQTWHLECPIEIKQGLDCFVSSCGFRSTSVIPTG